MDGAPRTVVREVVDEVALQVQDRFQRFLESFNAADFQHELGESTFTESQRPPNEYVAQATLMMEEGTSTIYVNFRHLQHFDETLSNAVIAEFFRFEPFLHRATQLFVQDLIDQSVVENLAGLTHFFVAFFNLPTLERVRGLRSEKVGQLVSIVGTVTRTTEVRPELLHGTFMCGECGTLVRGVPQQFRYTEPQLCPRPACNNRTSWQLQMGESQFVDWQRLRVQENSDEIPAGSMPRSVELIVRHENVEKAKAGDKCVFTGCVIVLPDVAQLYRPGSHVRSVAGGEGRSGGGGGGEGNDGVTGLRQLGVRDLTYKLAFLVSSIQPAEQRAGGWNIRDEDDEERKANSREDLYEGLTPDEEAEVVAMRDSQRLYTQLAQSLAPNVFGHEEIKRGILLMLFGGVHKSTPEGMKLRGDVNICVVGDPSTAKSQFLTYVNRFLPRAVYTSGKASSAAGLTASVVKDQDTGEFCIEAGALMLADNGICCIDEFDKMDVADQVAIHEAMEQQTISITKAGIQATLNARASILAAANPVFGRYDRSKTLRQNVTLSAPIMSRFDLFFVVLDENDEATDQNIARHIVSVHRNRARDYTKEVQFSKDQIQRYIKVARRIKPSLTRESQELLVKCYLKLRAADSGGSARGAYRITVRQLESMIRLSEALARVHHDFKIQKEYVLEAYRLLQKSVIHVDTDDVVLDVDMPEPDRRAFVPVAAGAEEAEGEEAAEEEMAGEPVAAAKRPRQISFEEYQRVANSIVLYLRQHETEDSQGMRQGDVVSWYIEQQAARSAKEAGELRALVNQIMRRMREVDNVLVTVQEPEDSSEQEEIVVSVHPNYVMD